MWIWKLFIARTEIEDAGASHCSCSLCSWLSVCGHAIILDVPQNHYRIDIFVTSAPLFSYDFGCRQCDCEQEMLLGMHVLGLLECILADAWIQNVAESQRNGRTGQGFKLAELHFSRDGKHDFFIRAIFSYCD